MPSVEYEDINSKKGTLNKDIFSKPIHKSGQYFQDGDILFGKLRPYLGNNLLASFDGIAVGDFWIFKKGLANTRFIYPFLYSKDYSFISNISSGSKMPRSDWGLISSWNFNIPSSEAEQTLIGDLFANIDKSIYEAEREITRLEKMKQASLQKMFPRPGETTPEIRFDGFTEPWKLIQLRHICESFKYGLNAPAKKFDGIHKYLRITDIDDTSHQFNQADLTSPDTEPLTEEYRLHPNDIVFARTGASVGKTYLYDEKDGEVFWAGFLIRAHVSNEFDSSFIFYITTTRMYWDYIAISSQRSGQPGVNAEQYAEFSFYVPTLPEQKKIGEYFRNLDAIISAKRKKLEKLQNLKQSCLDKMFVNTTAQ